MSPQGTVDWKALTDQKVVRHAVAGREAAYRELIRKNHPDKVAHLSKAIRQVAEAETRRLNGAYEEAQQMLGRGGNGQHHGPSAKPHQKRPAN